MASRDDQIDRARRQLAGLLSKTYAHVGAAAMLLKHRADHAPNTAEAHAYELLVQAQQSIDRWIEDTGGLVGVKLVHAGKHPGEVGKEAHEQIAEADARTETEQTPAGDRSGLAAGGETEGT